MKNLSALEIAFLASELAKIGNSKLQQVYQPARKELEMQFHVRSEGRAVLKVRVPSAAFLASRKEGGEITGFCSLLRRKLNGAILGKVSQHAFERILLLEFSSKTGQIVLILELFSKGNIILVQDGRIVAAQEKQHWSTREVAVNSPYSFPPPATDPRTLDAEKLLQLLKGTNKADIVRFLAIELSLGGLYAEELCLLAGVDKKTKPAAVTAATAKKLIQALASMLNSGLSPSVIYGGGNPVDAVPVQLRCYKDYASKSFKTFSEALESYYSSTAAVSSAYDGRIKKLLRIIEQQESAIESLKEESAADSRRGELIYEHYQDVKKLLEIINQMRREGSWDEVRKLAMTNKKIKSVDEKSGKIVVDVQ